MPCRFLRSSAVSDSGRPAPSSLWRDARLPSASGWARRPPNSANTQACWCLPLFAVLTLDASAGQLGVLRAVGQAPILLLSLFVGAWVDRWRTRTVMVLTDAGRALALGAAALAGLLGLLGLPALLVVAFAVGRPVRVLRRGLPGVSRTAGGTRPTGAGQQRARGQPVRGADRRSRPRRCVGVPAVGADRRRRQRAVLRAVVPVDPADPSPRSRSRSARNVPLGYGGGFTRASVSSSATPRCGPCAWPRPPSSSPSRP